MVSKKKKKISVTENLHNINDEFIKYIKRRDSNVSHRNIYLIIINYNSFEYMVIVFKILS